MSNKVDIAGTLEILKKAENLILVSHISPDGDTFGSTLALAEALKQMGKKVTCMLDDVIPATYKFLPGISEYVRPQKGDHFTPDLLVVIDSSSLDRIGEVANYVTAPILNIDHHISNNEFAKDLWLDATAAATGEMIFALLKTMQVDITLSMAICLYTAIVTDCGYFKYSNTTPKTLSLASELVSLGVEPNVVSDFLEMKSRDNLALLTKVLNSLEYAANGKIAYIEINHKEYNKDIDTDSFIQYPRYIEGVEVALMFKAVKEDEIRISIRSRWIDVSKIAKEFNGGGHAKASGCTIPGNLQNAKDIMLKRIEEEMDKYK